MRPLLVLGSINADLYVELDRLPRPGETVLGRNVAMRPGGKGANQAAAAAKLGFYTRFAGQLGDDAYATALRAALADAGVDTTLLARRPGPSGQAVIMLQRGGENSIIVVGGANQDWAGTPAAVSDAAAKAGALLLQREVPETLNLAVAEAARAAGVPVLLDAGGADEAIAPELLALLDLLSPNETELARLTGMPMGDDDLVLAAARALLARGVRAVLVKLGSRGAMLVEGGAAPIRARAFAVPVVDTTGAGDCFTAAYAVALLEGMPGERRLRFANAAAAICVQRLGALPSMPTRDEVEALLSGAPSPR